MLRAVALPPNEKPGGIFGSLNCFLNQRGTLVRGRQLVASTPFPRVQTINGLLAAPQVRKNYQFWVFAYPTGNPVSYSAQRLREELARVDRLYPNHRDYVLVGHSMGGILCHMQVTTLTRRMWEKALGETAREVFHPTFSPPRERRR